MPGRWDTHHPVQSGRPLGPALERPRPSPLRSLPGPWPSAPRRCDRGPAWLRGDDSLLMAHVTLFPL